ncbi:MAG TPA: MFS transporter [Tepidisphaeraceae bacterium]|nr:MFS transporter [Tepidisphaeraceae bacterium]
MSKPTGRWWQNLDRYCWTVLIAAAMGWLFDTMDQNLYNLVRGPSLTDLLKSQYTDPAELSKAVTLSGSWITAIFLLGWSAGGFLFGILGDRLGRMRTMVLTILIYAVFTGLSGLSTTWQMYAVMRFLTAMGVGGEWAAGAALVAETFPAQSRAMALGLLQALSAVGNMVACLITLGLGNLQEHWRWAYFVGAAPALMVVWIRRSVHEPPQWHEAKVSATMGRELGNIRDLFLNRVIRRNTIAAVLLATAGVGSLWGIAYFSPEMVSSELKAAHFEPARISRLQSITFLLQQAGAFFGAYAFAPWSQRVGRRWAFVTCFLLAWSAILAFFWGIQGSGEGAFVRSMVLAPVMGFCTLGAFAGYTVYFPELFPTRLRATGCGFCYNAARILAAAAPFALGSLRISMGGFAQAASVVSCVLILGFIGACLGPETRGHPLPEDADFDPIDTPLMPKSSVTCERD